MLNVAIIGCGLVGRKRASALAGARLVACVDRDLSRAQELADETGASLALSDPAAVFGREDISIIVVATPHDSLAQIAGKAVEAGKHVLVEKPAGRNRDEVHKLAELAECHGVLVRVGFNHRHHPAFVKARELVDGDVLGPLMYLRARYGHGGRVGYEKEWRASPEISGGGELIDQGVHIIDLARWFLGDFTDIEGFAHTYFWPMPVEDNAFLMLRTPDQKMAFLHASCTEWKNMFSFELYGRAGKLQIDGLGGSYGTERLTLYKMSEAMGPPDTTTWEYAAADTSWEAEMAAFLEDIRLARAPSPGLQDAMAALNVVEKIYRDSGYDYRA